MTEAFPVQHWEAGVAGRAWTVTVTKADKLERPDEALAESSAARQAAAALDDAALIAACVAGDREAFDVIVERYRRDVYRLCYRFTGNHEDSADLAQDVFLRAYRSLGGFRGQAAFRTWLYRIAINVCLNRVTARLPPIDSLAADDALPSHELGPAALLLAEERAKRVRAAVARLPRKQRATLVLRVYHELSHQEIAGILGGTVGGVKANFFHALRNLKRILSRDSL